MCQQELPKVVAESVAYITYGEDYLREVVIKLARAFDYYERRSCDAALREVSAIRQTIADYESRKAQR
jgi:hypothetical protein